MKILVLGATGPTGVQLVMQGMALGHEITAAVRRPETAQLPAGVRVVKADISEAPSLLAAVSGQEAVVSALGTKLSRQPTTVISEGTRHILNAMRDAGVRRFVCVSGVGAGDSRGHGGFFYDKIFQPLMLNEIYKDKDRQEAIIRESGVDWTIVRPGMLTNGAKTGQCRSYTDLRGVTLGKISRADVAAYIWNHINDASSARQTVNISY